MKTQTPVRKTIKAKTLIQLYGRAWFVEYSWREHRQLDVAVQVVRLRLMGDASALDEAGTFLCTPGQCIVREEQDILAKVTQ